ncbi:fibrohexamerin-like [Zerene cesonia]|uniref:fibrohexamerin-like n=1 Tax=Zerene cesonia TaxID=33412 RepID=UPI0018E500DB|nr:fibrohexamerin-like [Zerene cesonia]
MLVRLFFVLAVVAVCYAVPSNIVRPCHYSHTHCLRENFASNSKCNPNVRGSIPAEYTIPRFAFDTPYFNASYVDVNLKIRNHNNCKTSEFFYNIESDTLVIAIDCPFLQFESTRTLIQHYSLQEDTSYSYFYKGTYPMIRVTMNIPRANEMDACSAYAFADVTALPIFDINPNDVKTANFLSTDYTLLNIFERETFYFRAKQLITLYINSYICDFGCN